MVFLDLGKIIYPFPHWETIMKKSNDRHQLLIKFGLNDGKSGFLKTKLITFDAGWFWKVHLKKKLEKHQILKNILASWKISHTIYGKTIFTNAIRLWSYIQKECYNKVLDNMVNGSCYFRNCNFYRDLKNFDPAIIK